MAFDSGEERSMLGGKEVVETEGPFWERDGTRGWEVGCEELWFKGGLL